MSGRMSSERKEIQQKVTITAQLSADFIYISAYVLFHYLFSYEQDTPSSLTPTLSAKYISFFYHHTVVRDEDGDGCITKTECGSWHP